MIKKQRIFVLFIIAFNFAAFFFAAEHLERKERQDYLAASSVRIATVAEERARVVENWYRNLNRSASLLSREPTISMFLEDFSELMASSDEELWAQAKLQAEFTENILNGFVENIDAHSALLLNKEGVLISSSISVDAVIKTEWASKSQIIVQSTNVFLKPRYYQNNLYQSVIVPIPKAENLGQDQIDRKNPIKVFGPSQIAGYAVVNFNATKDFKSFIEPMPLAGRKDEIRLFFVDDLSKQVEYFHKGGKNNIRTENYFRELALDIFKGNENSISFSSRRLGGSNRLVFYSGKKIDTFNFWVIAELNGRDIEKEIRSDVRTLYVALSFLLVISIISMITILIGGLRREKILRAGA